MAPSSTGFTLCRLQPGHVDLPMLRQIYQGNVHLALAEEARADVLASQETVTRIVASIPGSASWRKPVFRPSAWRNYSAIWCCRTAWGRVNIWRITSCAW